MIDNKSWPNIAHLTESPHGCDVHTKLDDNTMRKLVEIHETRSGTLGKPNEQLTYKEEMQYGIHFNQMPGEYRSHKCAHYATRSTKIQRDAKACGVDLPTFSRMLCCGNVEHNIAPSLDPDISMSNYTITPSLDPDISMSENMFAIECTPAEVRPT